MSKEIVKADSFGMGVHEQDVHHLYSTFYFGKEMFGVDALQVQEIVRFQKMTPVPHSPDYILGLINLRGQIVTAIDLKYRLMGSHIEMDESSMIFILKSNENVCSVVVDDVGDVLDIGESEMEPPPETMDPQMRSYVTKICKLKNQLLCILDIAKVIAVE